MVRSRDDFDHDFTESPKAFQVKLQDIDAGFDSDEIEVQTSIVNQVYEWTFRLKAAKNNGRRFKDAQQASKDVLCKLKLLKNLTSGERASDRSASAQQ